MDAGAVPECFRDKTILVTGSTGFLEKLLVEKILRVQPDVKKLYLLVLENDLFNTLREKHGLTGFRKLIDAKIVPLDGDVGLRNFGINSSRVDALCEEVDVIINGAATTSFYERYDVGLASNVLGAKYGCELAKRCRNLKMLLHVSTAFVAGTQEGLLPEKALQMGETLRHGYRLDIEAEFRLVEKVKTELTTASSSSSGQLKTTMKELEMLLGQQKGDLRVVIIRPTMVTSTYQDPFPGWIEGARTIDALIVAYNEQAFPCFIGDHKDTMDAVPADMVVNATLVAMSVHWNEKAQVIYHVCSSLRNPLNGYVFEDACMDYFSIHPRVLENGKPLQNRRPYLFKRFAYFHAYLILVYKLPLEMLHAVSLLFCGLFSQYYNKYNRRYTFLVLLVKLYAPYAFFKGCFDDTNLRKLRMELKMIGQDGNIFNFDPNSIDWYSYLLSVHIPAVLNGHRKLALELIKAEPALSTDVNRMNESPMYIAAMRDFTDISEALLEVRDSAHMGPCGQNTLQAAVKNGNAGLAKKIMKTRPWLAKEADKNGCTPLSSAVYRGLVDVAVLLEHDFSLGYEVPRNGNPFLSYAAYEGHLDVAQELLKHCPDTPYRSTHDAHAPYRRTSDCATWLHSAVSNDHAEFVEFILRIPQLSKLVNMQDSGGKTALHYAVKNCNPRIVTSLLSHKGIDGTMLDNNAVSAGQELEDDVWKAKTLNWNEVIMLMSKACPQDAPPLHNIHVKAKRVLTKASRENAKSLTQTYTSSTSLVAILIATITFAAAFTLPGGYTNDSGSEDFPSCLKFAFQAFLISDVIAMCSSFTVAFICIIASFFNWFIHGAGSTCPLASHCNLCHGSFVAHSHKTAGRMAYLEAQISVG
ncbi:hypothetical protein ZWY2020_026064 [Hordeum vulgare]|nr:hypothetical protein ZWY2020_026064 [Hordeum vulgare]